MDGKLIDACALLFGSHTRGRGLAMLDSLDTTTVRRAYRVLAVANHPDALRRNGGRQGPADGKLFIDISHAYELLMGYLLKKAPASAAGRAGRHSHAGPASPRATGEKRNTEEKREEPGRRGTGAKPGAGYRAGAGTRTGTGEKRSGAGAKTGAGAKAGAGTRSGAGARSGPGQKPGAGNKPGAGDRSGARAGAGTRSGAGTKTGAGTRAGAGARQGAGSRSGTGSKPGAGEKRASGQKRGPDFTSSRSTPLFYHGPVPRQKLRLAEYLYYTGHVSWQSLIAAIVWQRQAQPRFGELAREMRGISGQDLARILSSRLRHEQTGQTAQRLQLLTNTDVERILRLQRARRKLIGRYFVEKGGVSGPDLNAIIWEMHKHNARYGKQSTT